MTVRYYPITEPINCPNRHDDGQCSLRRREFKFDYCPRYEFPDWCELIEEVEE